MEESLRPNKKYAIRCELVKKLVSRLIDQIDITRFRLAHLLNTTFDTVNISGY